MKIDPDRHRHPVVFTIFAFARQRSLRSRSLPINTIAFFTVEWAENDSSLCSHDCCRACLSLPTFYTMFRIVFFASTK
jgi:hypothetical protein